MTDSKTELQKNAIALARRKELENYQRELDIGWLNNRMSDGNMGRCLARIQQEFAMEKEYQERTDHAALVNERARKEIDLATEIEKVRHDETTKLLRQHYLREHDPSLIQLMKKLQAGYVCKDQRQQILHNEYRRLQEKAEEEHANRVLLDALYNDEQQRFKEEKEKIEQNAQYCKEIQQQIVNTQRQKQCQYEETLIEKKMLDDIMKTISDEDMKELQHKREQMAKTRHEMEATKLAREAWRLKQKEVVMQETRRREKQVRERRDVEAELIAARQRKLEQKEKINEIISAKVLAEENERKERENIIKSLQEQEYLEKGINDALAENRKLEMTKRQTHEALTRQMEEHRQQAKQTAKSDEDYRKQVEEKLRKEDEKEREKERKKQEKQQQYARDLKQQIMDNAVRNAKNKASEDWRNKSVFDSDADWRKEVQQERKKIIEEHAPHVLGFLQAGVLKPDDLPAVRTGADQAGLGHLEIEAMGVLKGSRVRPKCNPQCVVLREY